MTNEELEMIRDEYNKKLKAREIFKISRLKWAEHQIRKYEENTVVKEYLALLDEYENSDKIYSTDNYKIDDLITNITPTNDIYVYQGTYIDNSNEDDLYDFLIERDDPRADYRVYMNIETKGFITEVPISECEDFEKKHTVILCDNVEEVDESFYKFIDIRREFFKTAIEEGQEKAVEKILTKYKKI